MTRKAKAERKTKETDIRVEIDLDGTGKTTIETPLPFLSHMLEQIGRHGAFDLTISAKGDVEIAPDGSISVEAPVSNPGDHIDLRAEMDLLVAITACSAEQSNGGTFKPIDIEIFAPPAQ